MAVIYQAPVGEGCDMKSNPVLSVNTEFINQKHTILPAVGLYSVSARRRY